MQIVLLTKCLELWDLIGKMKPSRQYFQLFSSNAGSTFAMSLEVKKSYGASLLCVLSLDISMSLFIGGFL